MPSPDNRVKFLVIRFSSIGDIVLTTPIIRNLKNQTENAEIHFLTKEAFAPVLEANPYIDKLHLLGKDFNSLVHELKAEKFDYIIDLHRNLRTMRVRLALKRMSFSFDKLNFKKWLLVNLKVDKMPRMHIVERYMKTIQFFIEEQDEKGLDYFIPAKDNYNLIPTQPFVAVVVGANHFTKQLPNDKLIELCKAMNKPIVLLGGKVDEIKASEIVSGTDKDIKNLVGKLNINQSASVIQQAEWVITPDTGLMHIAAAFQRKIISYWGNTVPEFGMTPYKPSSHSVLFEEKELKCRPCSKIGYKECPKGHFKCMLNHDVMRMAALVNN